MNAWLSITWAVVNIATLIVAFGFLQSLACTARKNIKLFILGDVILALLVIRRSHTMLVDILPREPHQVDYINRYLWPTIVAFCVLMLCIELHEAFSPKHENTNHVDRTQ